MNPHNPDYHPPPKRRSGGGPGCIMVVVVGALAVIGFMFSSVMGFVAPNRGLEPMQAAAIENLVDKAWRGSIDCDDGARQISVAFNRQLRAQTHVTAEVHWLDAAGEPIGDYLAKGTFDGVRLNVTPDSRGSGAHRPVALVGSVSDAQADTARETIELLSLTGDVIGDPACTGFSLNG